MLWTGLIMAALVAATPAQQAATPTAPATPANMPAPAATPPERGADSRALVCENRPVTGRRINQRRCRTPAQVAAAQSGVQGLVTDIQNANASAPDVILNGGPR